MTTSKIAPVERLNRSALLRAAAVLLICIVGAWLIVFVTGNETVDTANPDDLSEELLELASDPQLSQGRRLGLLTEAAGLGVSDEVMALLGAELRERGELVSHRLPNPDVLSGTIDPGGKHVMFTVDQQTFIWRLSDGEVSALEHNDVAGYETFTIEGHVFSGPNTPVVAVETQNAVDGAFAGAPLPGGRFAAGFPWQQRLELFDAEMEEVTADVWVSFPVVKGIRGAPDGSLLVVGQPPTLDQPQYHQIVWDTATGELVTDHPLLEAEPSSVGGIAFSPDGSLAAVATESEIRLLDASTFEVLRTVRPVGRTVNVAFTERSNQMVVTSTDSDGTYLSVWNPVTTTLLLGPIPVGAQPDDSERLWRRGTRGPANGLTVVPSSDGSGLQVWIVDPLDWIGAACGVDDIELSNGSTACSDG